MGSMDDLIQVATDLIEKKYLKPVHTVSAVLETESGKIF